jgi:hypothetical protein
VLAAIAVVAVFSNTLDFGLFKTFSPLREQVRNDTFKQSQAYNEGTIGDLMGIKDQYYQTKDQAAKESLRETFIYKAQHYPNQLPPELSSFYSDLKNQ